MTRTISLALVIHNHQPVGNFGWVIGDVYEKAYEPLIGALERHPDVRLALHYSGSLLDWIERERPEFLERLRALVERDQVEVLGGGMYEPILVALPERDRIGQLAVMRSDIERRLGRSPAGAWLAERVWEPSLPAALADAGYAYTVLDDNHLRNAFVPEDEMWGSYTTDDQGRLLTVFGTEKGLRYRIPWHPVPDLIEYLRDNATEAGERLGMMGDDGEKFGAWPGTHELCWSREEWVEQCFSALEQNADWLTTVTPSGWMAGHAPLGRVYVPSSSYVEMTEWALPVAEVPAFQQALTEATDEASPALRFLRGAMWRNFQARYREVNDMHKQMQRTSTAVAALPAGAARDAALDHLYRGQSNDCYWHGLFGGIYIVHMRMATLAELIAAEDLALGSAAAAGTADFDLDGSDEIMLGTPGQSVLVDIAEGAAIGAWDLRATRLALASVMRRRPEAYHARLRALDAAASAEGGAAESANPHETQRARQAGLAELLVYDDHERRSGLVRVVTAGAEPVGDFDRGAWQVESASGQKVTFSRRSDGLELRKTIALDGGRLKGGLELAVELSAQADFEGALELEWNINLLGGGANPAAFYRTRDDEWRHDTSGSVDAAATLRFGNEYEGAEITVTLEPPTSQHWFAVQTVSSSEAGFEAVYQGSCLNQRWPLRLTPGERKSVIARLDFSQSRDRSAEEAGQA